MKSKVFFLAAVIFPCLPVVAHAQTSPKAEAEAHDQSFFVGTSIARAQVKNDGEKANFKDAAPGGKVFGGFNINPSLGVQAGVAYLGTAKSESGTQRFKERPLSVFGAVTGAIPLSEQISLTGKVGVTRNGTKISSYKDGVEQNKNHVNKNIMYGVGVDVKLNSVLSAVVEYENFGKVAKEKDFSATGKMVSAGLVYRF